MPDEMDVQRLMAEVKKRPTIWDVHYAEYKDRTNTPQLWTEIADILGADVEHCKRKWKNLRDAYRAEVRRTERRLERLKATGQYDPKMNIASKWMYFEPMSFINESRRKRHSVPCVTAKSGSGNGSGSGGGAGSEENEPSSYDPKYQSYCDVKMEPQHGTTDEDDDEENDMLFEEFKSVATPQAARRLSSSLGNNVEEGPTQTDGGPSCKCSKRADDQVHFLENLEREEQKLMQSTRQEITRSNSSTHVGDSDYNFLVSFLPQMKKMCELQNLQFRAKMSELVLNILAPTMTAAVNRPSAPTPHTAATHSLPALTLSQTPPSHIMNISSSTSTPQQQQQQTSEHQQQLQQQQLQMIQSELMEAEQTNNGTVTNAVATSSSNWS